MRMKAYLKASAALVLTSPVIVLHTLPSAGTDRRVEQTVFVLFEKLAPFGAHGRPVSAAGLMAAGVWLMM